MGLHRLDPRDWLEVDARRADELRRKDELLRVARQDVLATTPGGAGSASELLDLVIANLHEHHAGTVAVADDVVVDASTRARVELRHLHPIEAASRLVQEDLCVLEHHEDAWTLTSACVCFPSRWRLTDKIGHSLQSIHDPVPGFDTTLARPATTFFDRLGVERPVWRLNWTLLDTPELHLPTPAARRRTDAPADPSATLWFRVERQTLRRLEQTGAIAFTIRTYVSPLGELIDRHPSVVAALRDTLRTVAPDVAAYKGWSTMLDPLLAWLDSRAEQ